MKKTTPFLTGFSTHLFGSAKRSTQAIIAQKRQSLLEGTLDLQQQFMEEVPPEVLAKYSDTERNRHYPDHLTFWAFFSQVANEDASCAATVARVQAWAEQRGLPVPSENTGAYCQARADLPVAMLRAVNDSLLGQLDAHLPGQKILLSKSWTYRLNYLPFALNGVCWPASPQLGWMPFGQIGIFEAVA